MPQIGQISSRSVKLKWKVLFDGNSPVIFFTVTHNISNGTVSYNVSSIKRQYKVLYLTPATFYKFSVTATNQLGTSDRVVVNTTTFEAGTVPFVIVVFMHPFYICDKANYLYRYLS